jgi:hypothetical protein
MNNKIVFIYLLFLLMGVLVFNGTTAHAAVIHVTTTQDKVQGSLREAITEANNNDEDDIINLPAGKYFLDYGANENYNIGGDLDIYTNQSITIRGENPRTTIINGDEKDRVLHIRYGTVSISNVTIQKGKTYEGKETDIGGHNGGGICNSGELTLINCVVRNNGTGTGTGSGGYDGGGIFNNGSLILINCTINNNVTGPGKYGSYFDSGTAGGYGGGIFNNNFLTLTNCTISNNMNGKGGDAEWFGGDGGSGGGIFNNSSGTAFITSCTISSNSAGEGGVTDGTGLNPPTAHWGYPGYGGGICNWGSVIIKNTIIANNGGDGPDCSGTLNSQGYNLIENMEHCTITGIKKGNITGIDPLLGALAYNGGPTKTQALLPGSPAIDAGYSFGTTNDQRGFVRPYDIPNKPNVKDGSDIGAFEYASSLSYYNISGKITCNGSGFPGVTLMFSNNGGTTTTGTSGKYSHNVPYGWSGTAAPEKPGYTFIPSSKTYNFVTIDQANQDYAAELIIPPQISLNRTQLNFGADTAGKQTPAQSFLISNSSGGILNWTDAADADWLNCNPASGTGPAVVTVSINPSGLLPGTYHGTITITDPQATNSPQAVNITLAVYDAGSTNLPFGSFDTPIHGAVVRGSIPVTGWALDNIGIESVKIYRDPAAGEGSGLVYIGAAVIVEGARPDIETVFLDYPNNYKAGWGYLMLTNGLPEKGNGTFTLYANALDKEGNLVNLGIRTIYCDNAHAVKPFGTLDTPAPGGAASGNSYVNFGWALTPLPNTIPTDGSTITVWVDGVPLGHPVYNQYRADIAALFPGYNNSDGAVGYYYLDTTLYKNGVHTISWSVKDNAGNIDGIGSRYFTVQNLTGSSVQGLEDTGVIGEWGNCKLQNTNYQQTTNHKKTPSAMPPLTQDTNTGFINSYEPLRLQKGFNSENEPGILYPDENGSYAFEIEELERIVLYLDDHETQSDSGEYKISSYCQGFLIDGSQLRPLPIGSTLDALRGVFYWQPGPGFLGSYEFLFIEKTGTGERMKKHIIVRIAPHSSSF